MSLPLGYAHNSHTAALAELHSARPCAPVVAGRGERTTRRSRRRPLAPWRRRTL